MPVLDLIAWSLLVVWAALLAGGFLFRSSPTSKPPVPAWIQATCSGILLLLAWYGYLLTRAGTDSARYALGIAGGMTVGLVGCLLTDWRGRAKADADRLLRFCSRLSSVHRRDGPIWRGPRKRALAGFEPVAGRGRAGGWHSSDARAPPRSSAGVGGSGLHAPAHRDRRFRHRAGAARTAFRSPGRGGASRTSQRTAYGRGTVCMPVAKCPKTWSRRRAKRLASVMDRQRSPFAARARPCPDRRFYLVGAPGFRLTLAHSSFPFVAFSAIITRNENLLANRHIQPTKRHVYQHIPLRPGNRMAAES